MEHSLNAPTTTPEDMDLCRAWAINFLMNPELLPVSFHLDGQKIQGLPKSWNPKRQDRRIDANIIETIYEGSHPESGLKMVVEIVEYQDFPVLEWVVWFSNPGGSSSPLLSEVMALDGGFDGDQAVLQHCNGDYYHADGYTPQQSPISPGEVIHLAPNGGRPCDGAFPYFRVQMQSYGFALAVGWPGQWTAEFRGVAGGAQIAAGQEKTYLRLRPGERIRTPRMTALWWAGDGTRAVNLWRRWYLAHILPRPDGRPLEPKLACAATEGGEEFTNANEENQVRLMDQFRQSGLAFDVWWIDAGWYPCRDEKGDKTWWRTGTWIPDPERFPQGFARVSRRAKEHGADLLVWFEPERVFAGSQLDREHPGWLLKKKEIPGEPTDMNRLLDLGNPECLRWLTDHVSRLIQENGIRIYRQDFNFPPLAYWRDNDDEERQGMRENLHVQGYLQFWDDLLRRNPGLWIDSCSSGGRRNDLETMRRSVPLHYSDYGYGNHPVKLAFHHTLFAWIPYFKEFTLSWDVCQPGDDLRFDRQVDSFSFHCGMAPMLFASLDIRRSDYDFALAVQMIDIWRRAAPLMLHGDYYPLTPFSKSGDQWVVWQFEIPERKAGLIQAVRLPDNGSEQMIVLPKVTLPGGCYIFENLENGEVLELPGQVLMKDGLNIRLPQRSGVIWFYHIED